MEEIVYLDNSSTTKPCQKSIDYLNKALKDDWGNPSSLHILGMNAELQINKARSCVAKMISCRDDEIIFTASGSEANNTALLSLISSKNRKGRIITTSIEHPSILETVKRLEYEGFEVIRLTPDSNGIIPISKIKDNLNKDTVLVSMMLVNNEVGSIQPVAEASKIIKSICPSALFHCDAVQAFGKLPINVKQLGVDLLSASGHKIHAPKGIGFLYCKKGVNLKPLITGGGQERGMRSGTESVPLICSLNGAIEELPDINSQLSNQQKIYDYSYDLFSDCDFISINSNKSSLPYIINISIPGYKSETILHFLEQRNIFVSSGSACSKGHGSYVLKEMGIDKKLIDSSIRISFSRYNTTDDIDKLYSALLEAVKVIRKV